MADSFLPKSVPWGTEIGKGGPILAAKIGPAGPILAAKVVLGTTFGRFFCQNRSAQIDFGMTGHFNKARSKRLPKKTKVTRY